MEDLTGLGKVAESVAKLADTQLVNKAYDDLLADAMKVGGKGLTDFIKAFRLFLAPIQLLAVAQDRLAAFCDRVRARVPEDRQQEAAPSIALPILMDLRFMEDENPLTELYLNLLARAIDKERCDEAHPAFVKIIEQMSPDEAMIMYRFRQNDSLPIPVSPGLTFYETCIPYVVHPKHTQTNLTHLLSLGLLREYRKQFRAPGEDLDHSLHLSRFGRLFVEACIPEDFDLTKFKGDQPDVAD